MSKPVYAWWGYAKNMIRRYPNNISPNENAAVEAAIKETARRRNGTDRLKIIEMVLLKGSHTLAGAALAAHVSERTAHRYHTEFIRCVGENFRCASLLEEGSGSDGRGPAGADCEMAGI